MKKLVVFLAVLFAFSFVLAADATSLTYSGQATFKLVVDEEGLDSTAYFGWISASGDLGNFGVTIGFFNSSLYGLSFENDLFGVDWATGGVIFDPFLAGGDWNGSAKVPADDTVSLSVKPLDGLEVVFMDLVTDGADIYEPATDTGSWFDDFIGLKYSFAGVNLAVAAYDTEDTNSTNTLNVGVHAGTSFDFEFGTLSLEGLFVNQFTTPATMAYGLKENFSGEFGIVSIEQNLNWFENTVILPWLDDYELLNGEKYFDVTVSSEYAVTEEVTVNGSLGLVIADLTAATDFTVPVSLGVDYSGIFSVGLAVDWDDVVKAATTIALTLNGGYETDLYSFSAEVAWDDVVGDATNLQFDANVSVTPLEALTLSAAVRYDADNSFATSKFGYNVSASYALGNNTTFSAFYGTLYTSSAAGYNTVIGNVANWYLQMVWSSSF